MPNPVRNSPDHSKYYCSADPDAPNKSEPAGSSGPKASGVGPLRAYTEAPSATPQRKDGASILAQGASKPSASIAVARGNWAREKVEVSTESGVEKTETGTKVKTGKVSAESTFEGSDGSKLAVKVSIPLPKVSLEVRDANQDGNKEICVGAEVSASSFEFCVPTYEGPPVEGARGASGDDRPTGAGGASGL
jgi:hypothetical protein